MVLSLIDWFKLSVLPAMAPGLFALDVIDFVALTLVQPSVTIMGSKRQGKQTHLPTDRHSIYLVLHQITVTGWLPFLAIIKLTLLPFCCVIMQGLERGRDGDGVDYPVQPVMRRRMLRRPVTVTATDGVRVLSLGRNQRQLGLTRVPHVQLKCQWLAIFNSTWHVSGPSRRKCTEENSFSKL